MRKKEKAQTEIDPGAPLSKVARWQNLIPWIATSCPPPWRNPRKERDQILPYGNLEGANRRLRRTFHLNETYGWLFANRNIGSNHGSDEVKQPSGAEVSDAPKSHLTATTSVQNIEDSDELGGGVELRIKIYSPFTY